MTSAHDVIPVARRSRLLLITVVLVLVAAVGFVAGSAVAGSSPWFRSCDIPDRITDEPAPVNGEIRVVEQGFSRGQKGDRLPDAEQIFLVGAVLENTTHRIAYHTRVFIRLLDSTHRELDWQEAGPEDLEIPILLPGQRIGLGSKVGRYLEREIPFVEVTVRSTTWVNQDAAWHDYSTVTATYDSAAADSLNARPDRTASRRAISYTESSANCRALTHRTTALVFRDSAGKIVGGTSTDLSVVPGRACTPGERKPFTIQVDPQPTVDYRRTEVYPHCDLQSPPVIHIS